MNMIRRLLAAILLLGVVIGAPIALWVFGRDLLPDHVPSRAEVWSFFTERDTGSLFLGALVLIGILAWLVFTVSVVVELAAMMAGRRGQWRIPGLRIPQGAAAALIAVAFTTTFAVATAMPAAAASGSTSLAAAVHQYQHTAVTPGQSSARPAGANTAPNSIAATTTTPFVSPRSGPTWTVGRYDTLWRIAERALGDGPRFREIVELNQGVAQADGYSLRDADTPLRTGWVLRLPSDAQLSTSPAVPAPRTVSAAPAVHVEVHPGDTLSQIAQQQLGNADLYPQLAQTNHLNNPDDLEVGQTLTIPPSLIQQVEHNRSANSATTTRTVRVQPGDTLMSIAHREMGDAELYNQLAQANHIANPNDILAGSSIVIPATHPTGAPSTVPGTTNQHAPRSTPAPARPTPHSTPANSAATPSTKVTTSPHRGTSSPAGPTNTAAPAPVPSPLPTPATTSTTATTTQLPVQTGTPRPTAEQAHGAAADTPPAAAPTPNAATPTLHLSASAAAPDTLQVSSVASLLGITGAAAGAIWGALLLARRRGHRGRRPGRQSAPPSPPQVRAEKTLRERAAGVDVAWLDMALRSVGTVLNDTVDQMPDILGATVSPNGLRLQLSTPVPAPDPFISDGAAWFLPVTAELPITHANAVDQIAPLPTLTSFGSRGEETVFVDLERLGAINLTGDPDTCRALLTHVATELALQNWSDGLHVTFVGWGRALVALNPERLSYAPSTAVVIRALQARAAAVTTALATMDIDVLRARAGDVAADSWAPQVLLIDASNTPATDLDQLQGQLVGLAGAGRIATAVLMTGAPGLSTDITVAEVTAAGVLRMPRLLGGGTITAACMTEADVELVVGLFDGAEQVDHPIPVSDVDELWAVDMDSSGALIPPVTMDEPVDLLEVQDHSAPQEGGAGSTPIPTWTTHCPDRDRLTPVMTADPTLDADLAEWHQVMPRRPRIAILGTAEVAATGDVPKRLAWFTEVSVYLALHRGGVSLDKFTADLWPAEGRPGEARQIARSTRNETVSKIRRWLGTDPATGDLYVPLSTDGTYKLEDRLLDVELMQRLRKRGDARVEAGDRSAIEDYEAALKLVRGRPLPESTQVWPTVPRTGTGWGWLSNENRREDLLMPGWVVDVAHRAVQTALSINDLEKARWAADLGHEADPYSDVPLTDLVVIAAAAGDMATAHRHAWEVVWANDLDNAEELPEHTYSVISRVFPNGLLAMSR